MNQVVDPTSVAQVVPDLGHKLPNMELFDAVVGQNFALGQLRAAARRPVHAYLIVGPEGSGHVQVATGFAAALLCDHGGCASCLVCGRVLGHTHPDVTYFERAGAQLSVEQASEIVALAQRKPLEARRQVIVVSDIHLALRAGPALLKTLEEPAAQTVFVLLAEFVPAELATIASRCVRVDLHAISEPAISDWLVEQGIEPGRAAELAAGSFGSIDRARLLAHDDGFAVRRDLWRSIPNRLDGTGATAALMVGELIGAMDEANAPLREEFEAELEELTKRANTMGERIGASRKAAEERHKRHERRWRADEVKSGLALLARIYRDRMLALSAQLSEGPSQAGREQVLRVAKAFEAIEECGRELVRNPNETLMLEALLVRLSAVSG